MSSLFISYSRRDITIARKLTDALQGHGLDFWIDWEGIPPTVDWWKEIEKGIEEADIFLFLISPDSAKSKVCKQEIEHAIKNGKRLTPIVIREVTGDEAPTGLGHLNWIFLRENDDFDTNFNKLITAIKTDYEWVQTHRQLQVKALEWERSSCEKSFLLHGKELQDAESQLATNTSKPPHPTDLQRRYVHESRQATDRQRTITAGISLAGIIVLAALAVFGFTQAALATANAQRAENLASTAQAASTLASDNAATAKANAQDARAGELAAKSAAIQAKNFPVSLLLAIESFKLKDIPQSRGALLDNAYANRHLYRYLLRHHAIVTSVAFSPDGTLLASASADGTIVLTDTQQFKTIQQLAGHTDRVIKITFSPDGRVLASASKDKGIILWGMKNYQPKGQPLAVDKGVVTSIAFSPDGKILAAGNEDRTIILWDVQSQSVIGDALDGNEGGITSLAFSSDGNTLVSGTTNNKIILWDMKNREPFTFDVGTYVYDVAFKPNSDILAIATCGKYGDNGFCSQGKVILWDTTTHQPAGQPLIGHDDYVSNVVFSPDGKILASGSWDKTIILWDTENHQPLSKPLFGHTSNVNSITFSPDGKLFASGGGDQAIILWDVKPRQPIGRQYDLGHRVFSSAVSPDGKHFASGSSTGAVYLWDVTSVPPTDQILTGHSNGVNALSFSPDNKILASGDSHATIILWDVETGQQIGQPLTGHTDVINALAFSPDGKTLASGSWDNHIILWDVSKPASPRTIATLSGDSEDVISLAFSPDGKMLASGYKGTELPDNSHDNAVIILWNVETGQPIGQPLTNHKDSVNSLVFSPDGKYLFSGSWDKTILQWDAQSRQPIGVFVGHNDYIYSIAINTDGTMLASGSSDKTIILWDIASHQPIGQPLAGHNGEVISAAFSDENKTLVTTSWDNTVIFWSLEASVWIEKTCERVERNFTRAEWSQYFPGEEYRLTCPQWPAGK